MPRAARRGALKHEKAIPLARDVAEDDQDFTMDVEEAFEGENDDEVDVDTAENEDAATPTSLAHAATKKTKKKDKRAALMQKLMESSIPVSPYSKSHNRRLKRKTKQSLGLDAVSAALDEAMPEMLSVAVSHNSSLSAPSVSKSQAPVPPATFLAKRTKSENQDLVQKKKTSPGKIGEDTVHRNLSSRQRQKMLAQERERLPAILAHKSFAANPFETIRLHAQNTIVPLERSRKAGK